MEDKTRKGRLCDRRLRNTTEVITLLDDVGDGKAAR